MSGATLDLIGAQPIGRTKVVFDSSPREEEPREEEYEVRPVPSDGARVSGPYGRDPVACPATYSYFDATGQLPGGVSPFGYSLTAADEAVTSFGRMASVSRHGASGLSGRGRLSRMWIRSRA